MHLYLASKSLHDGVKTFTHYICKYFGVFFKKIFYELCTFRDKLFPLKLSQVR